MAASGVSAVRCAVLSTLVILATAAAAEYRTLDGTGNNLNHVGWGAAGSALLRLSPTSYTDGVGAVPAGPEPRVVSNTVFTTLPNRANSHGVSVVAMGWAHLVAHELAATQARGPSVTFAVPADDPLAPLSAPFTVNRLSEAPGTGGSAAAPRTPINFCSAYLDGSTVYGNSSARLALVRAFSNGLMLTSGTDGGGPWSDGSLMRSRDTESLLFGDPRGTTQPALLVMQAVMVLNHNWWATKLAAQHPDWEGNDEKLFQEARRRVVAEIQHITYNEYLPAVLGEPLPTYTGYNASLEAGVDVLFQTVAFRYGHTTAPSVFRRLANDGKPLLSGPLLLRDVAMRSSWVNTGGIGSVLLGMATSREMAVDVAVVEDLRNHLGIHGQPDLVAIDVFRGRDTGALFYADARAALGLSRPANFEGIPTNTAVRLVLERVYGTVDKVDVYVGALAENPVDGGIVGPLLAAIIKRQLARTRDSDRFWYEADQFTPEELVEVQNSFATIVRRVLPNDASNFPHPSFFATETAVLSSSTATSSGAGVMLTDHSTSSGTVVLDSAFTADWSLADGVLSVELKLQTLSCASDAWASMGFGANMLQADMIICQHTAAGTTCDDYWSQAQAQPATDVSLGGARDVSNVHTSCVDGLLTMSFSRPRAATTTTDVSLDLAVQNVLFAYAKKSLLAYHGPNRFRTTIDFDSGTSVVEDVIGKLFIIHGAALFIAWSIIAPAAICVMRFFRHKPWWLEVHKSLMSFVVSVSAISGAAAMAGTAKSLQTAHHIVGTITFFGVIVQGMLGYALRFWHTRRVPPSSYSFVRRTHWVLGYSITIAGFVSLYLGFQRVAPDYEWLMGVYLGLVASVGLLADWYHTFETKRRKGDPRPTPHLVSITPSELDRQISLGAMWVVVSGRVYDVKDFVPVHPGGSYLLSRGIGRDVTMFFSGSTTIDSRVVPHKHSFRAASLLDPMCVGVLVTEEQMLARNPSKRSLLHDVAASDRDEGIELVRPPSTTERRAATDVGAGAGSGAGAGAGAELEDLPDAPWLDSTVDASPFGDEEQQAAYHTWTVMHSQWITSASRPRPIKLVMLMPPLDMRPLPFSLPAFGKHVNLRVTMPDGSTPVRQFTLTRWGPSNPHTTQIPGAISLIVRKRPRGLVTPVLHDLRQGTTVALSGPHGLGFRLHSKSRGVVVGIARGTGLIAFLDLVQHMVDKSRAREEKNLAPVRPDFERRMTSTLDRGTSRTSGPLTPGAAATTSRSLSSDDGLALKTMRSHSSSGSLNRGDTLESTGTSTTSRSSATRPRLALHLLVLFGAKQDTVCLKWLVNAAAVARDRLKVHIHIEKGTAKWAKGHRTRSIGLLSDKTLTGVFNGVKEHGPLASVWVCGKPDFAAMMAAKLPTLGVPRNLVHVL